MNKFTRIGMLAVALIVLLTACTTPGISVHTSETPGTASQSSGQTTPSAVLPVTPTPVTPVTPTPSAPDTPTETPSGTLTPSVPAPTTPDPTPSTPDTPTPTPSVVVDPDKTRPENYEPFYPTDKVVAFTFDDGPCWVTPQILDVLEGTDDHVTFFMVGEMLDKNKKDYPTYVKRAYDMGCAIGSHTENHTTLYKSGKDVDEAIITEQLQKLEARYTEITGDQIHLMRPPGGAMNRSRQYGYPCVIWSLDSEDWRIYGEVNKKYGNIFGNEGAFKNPHTEKYETAAAEVVDQLVDRILSKVKSGDIILMHDIYFTSARAFKRIYSELKAQGYRFVTVPELLNIDPAEYDGWYFFSAQQCGHDNKLFTAKKPASTAVYALLPDEKERMI